MSELSNYGEDAILDHILGVTELTFAATRYLALFTSTATGAELEAGTLTNEVANSGSYARLTIDNVATLTFTAASGGSSENNEQWDFPTATGSWGTIRFVAIMDSGTHGAGNVIAYTQLDADVVIDSTDTFFFPAGNLVVTAA